MCSHVGGLVRVLVVRRATSPFGIEADGLRYDDGSRGGPTVRSFGVDVAVGAPIVGTPQEHDGSDTLAFVGLSPPRFRVYPVETHIAEKLHAYTLPRPNSRVKDLPACSARLVRSSRPTSRAPSPSPRA